MRRKATNLCLVVKDKKHLTCFQAKMLRNAFLNCCRDKVTSHVDYNYNAFGILTDHILVTVQLLVVSQRHFHNFLVTRS